MVRSLADRTSQLWYAHSEQNARAKMAEVHRAWIIKAGGTFVKDLEPEKELVKLVEISSLTSYAGENLDGVFHSYDQLKEKEIPIPLQLPFVLQSPFEHGDAHVAESGRRPSGAAS